MSEHPIEKARVLLVALIGNLEETYEKLIPEGWENSPFYDPEARTAQERYELERNYYEQFAALFKGIENPERFLPDPPRREDFRDEEPANTFRQFAGVLGRCLWKIFSENHEVYDKEGIYTLGSWRASGDHIAEVLNENFAQYYCTFQYLDFYCTELPESDPTSDRLFDCCAFLFRRLKERGCDWKYHFPRTYLIRFGKPEDKPSAPEDYDPAQAMEQEIERKKEDEEHQKMQDALDEAYHEAFEEAKYKKPPLVVRAYREVYGHLPEGYPTVD